ncbi:MAG: hypothetical protein NTW20_17190 [Rhodobacterales bacterium]|nr:hypothetical protein [Rhodobacterales bacterium]
MKIRTATILAVAWAPLPAFSEVCDKVNEAWKPGSDPIGFWPQLVSSVTSPLGVVVLLCCLAVAMTSRAALHFASTGILVVCAVALIVFEDPITALARREGCLGPALAVVSSLLALAAGMLARALTLRRQRSDPA